jgi:zinc D-Ala-D-Ala dipeptidase
MKPSVSIILVSALFVACAAPGTTVELSPATTFAAADLLDIHTLIPDLALDVRYASERNFVGTRIEGYDAPKCYLKSAAAAALRAVDARLKADGLRLKVFDCYRPARAVQHFVRWAENLNDQQTKAEYYPNLDKTALLGEYIAPTSGHSRGATIDLTVMRCDSDGQCKDLDMGTPFDFFDARANTDHPHITPSQRANRDRLREAMRQAGFENYAAEWWHYTFKPEPTPTLQYDVAVR